MKKEKDMIAFYPYYVQGNSYVQNMISVWSKKYTVIAFNNHNISTGKIKKCKAIILNWYENDLTVYKYIQLLICKLCGIQIIQVFHNRISHNSNGSIVAWIKMKSILLLSNTILLHSKNSRACLKQYGRNEVRKAVYVPHINYCGNFEYTEVNYREELGLKTDDFVFMFFGFMAPHKNIELLIQIFNEWNIDDAKLLIVGSPSNKQYIEKIKKSCLHKNIIIHGKYIPNSEVYAYFNTCDVAVMPYHKESYLNSGVMINAFSCGKTVIVPDIPMAQDMSGLCHVYHYNYEDEHKKALMDTMKQCYNLGKNKNHHMGEIARQYVIKNNSKERVLQCIKNLV